MYGLVKKAYDNFYYHPFIEINDVYSISNNLIVIAEDYDFIDRIDYIGICPVTNPKILKENCDLPRVALSSNRYIESSDRKTYQLLFGLRQKCTDLPSIHSIRKSASINIWGSGCN